MAKRISQLPEETSVATGDQIPIYDASTGTTKRATKTNFVADIVDGTLIEAGAITPDKRAGGFAVGTFTSPASTGNQSVTGLSFQPKLVKFTIGLTSATSSFMVLGGGAMTASSQFAYAWGARSALNGRHTRAASTTACLALQNISAGDVASDGYVASYVSMDADGFTVNFTTTATGATIYWEAYA